MVSVYDLIKACVIAVLYLAIIPFQKVVFPTGYYSVREILYNKNIRKAWLTSLSRLLFIAALSFFAIQFNYDNWMIILGVGLGSFLCVWPSIVQYNLLCFWEHKIKFLYLVSCILSVVYAIACSWFSLDTLIPLLFERKSYFLLENAGISLLCQVVLMLLPQGIRGLIDYHEEDDPYMDTSTFAADLSMTCRKMKFEQRFIKNYSNEIEKEAEKYGLNDELLRTIILLELVNRRNWYVRVVEYWACRLFPNFVIDHDCSLGIAQISVSIAKSYYKISPNRFLLNMLKPEESIALCAYRINSILFDFAEKKTDVNAVCNEYSLDSLSANDKLSLYIASKYICGCDVSLRKFALVYMTLIAQTDPIACVPAVEIDPDFDEPGNG